MYGAQTSGGGDSVGELATPGQFHRRLAPESEIRRGLSGPGHPTDVETIRKGSGMSVPVVPRVDTTDTATLAPTSPYVRSEKPLSDFPLPRREWFASDADLLAMGLQPPDRDAPTTTWKPGGSTYVVRRQRWVKIGRSRDLATRLTALRAPKPGVICPDGMDLSAPLMLICQFHENIERELHERYADHHVVGEWFTAAPVLAGLGVTA